MHGSEQFPIVVGELIGDVFGAHLFKEVSRSSLWTLLFLQGHLGEQHKEGEEMRE